MNGLVSKCFVVMILVLAGIFQEISAETVQIGFRLPTYPQSDRDSFLVQNFLLHQVFSEVDDEKRESCRLVLNIEGELVIEGEQEVIHLQEY